MKRLASKLALLCIALFLTGCATTQLLSPEELVVQKVVFAPGISKTRILEKTKIWFARTLRQSMAGSWEQNSTRTVIQYENGEMGVLIVNSAILYPLDKYGEAYKNGWEVRFTVQEDVKDGKARLTFRNLIIFVPRVFCGAYFSGWTSNYETRMTAEEYVKVKPALIGLADQLKAYLTSAEPSENW